MPLIGPIRPKYYINYTSASPNPDSLTSGALSEIVTCPKTGRMWIQQNVAFPYAWQQMLPYVAADGMNPTSAVQIANASGDMVVQRPAGMTGGNLNLFNVMTVDPNGVNLPTTSEGAVFVDANKQLRSELSSPIALGGDQSIATANQMTALSGMSFFPNESGRYRVTLRATFTHNNAFTASLGVRLFESASVNYVLGSQSGSAQGNNGWVSLTCVVISPCLTEQSFRAVVSCSEPNVVVKAKGAGNFPFSGIAQSPDAATVMYIERIG